MPGPTAIRGGHRTQPNTPSSESLLSGHVDGGGPDAAVPVPGAAAPTLIPREMVQALPLASVTADLALVPKDKVTPYPKSDFGGVLLDENTRLPLAFTRYEARRKYRRGAEGQMQPTDQMWPRMSILPIDDDKVEVQGKTY